MNARPEGMSRLPSPELAAELADFDRRNDAFGDMIDAAEARDDAAFERARAEFWGGGR